MMDSRTFKFLIFLSGSIQRTTQGKLNLSFAMLADLESWMWSLVFVLFTIGWFIYTSKSRTSSPLPPGPTGLPLVGALPFLDPELHTYFSTLSRRYGPVVSLRLGTKLAVIITSADAAKQVLKVQDITFANRDPSAAGVTASYGGIDIAFNSYGPEWRMMRKICVREMLCTSTLDAVYALRREELRKTVRYFFDTGMAGSPVNVGEQMFLTTLNVITGMMWGGTVKNDQHRDKIGSEFRQVVTELTQLYGVPNISDFIPCLAWLDLQGVVKRTKACAKRLDKIFDAVIDQRMKMDDEGRESKSDRKDFLQVLLKLKDDGDTKVPFTIFRLKSLLMDMVVGGTDTSNNATEFAMAELMNNPRTLGKLQEELDSVVGRGQMVEEADIHNLPYLQAVMKETLRLHPVLPLMVPHCPSQSTTLCGYRIPKGSQIYVDVWAIHRDPTVWDNPLEFKPERFLNQGKCYDFSGNDFTYIPFGSGRRMCAGISMAERMVLFSLATLVHSFDWTLPKEGDNRLDLEEKFGIVLKKKKPLVMIPLPRLSDGLYKKY